MYLQYVYTYNEDFLIICARCVWHKFTSVKFSGSEILKFMYPIPGSTFTKGSKMNVSHFFIMHCIVPHTLLRIRLDHLGLSCRKIKRCTHFSPHEMNFGKVWFQITFAFNNQTKTYFIRNGIQLHATQLGELK